MKPAHFLHDCHEPWSCARTALRVRSGTECTNRRCHTRYVVRPGSQGRGGPATMQLGMIGLGRMGGNMVRRLLKGGHACVVFDAQAASVTKSVQDGATGSQSLEEFTNALDTPRVVWLMLPAAVVETTIDALSPLLQSGDIVVDGGNSHYIEDIRRAKALEARGIH